jgi:capsular exopolysaccharide synthesis family protein
VIPHGVGGPRFRRLPILVHKAPRELAAGRPVKIVGPGSQTEIAEAFVRLATNVDFAGRNGPIQVLMVTSALPGEGKTTSAVNLALASARRGVGVLLIDADLRRGAIHELLRLPRAPGFSEVLAGLHPFEEVVRRVEVEGSKDLHVLTMGTVARNPSQLLVAVDLAALFGELRLQYEMIVIDSSPMNVVADATLFATISDGVIVVARAGITVPESLSATLEQLGNVNAAVVGTVLNDMDYRRDGASRKAYKYHGSYLVPQG